MHPSILVVDDDPAICSGVALLLEQAGYRTSTAATGAQAWALLAQPPAPDLVILDVRLPDLDGLTLCRQIRALPRYLPILMLSAYDELADRVAGLELGADDYVTKPFEPRELLARVRARLREADQAGGAPLVCGPLTLWRAEHRATIGGRALDLTPKEWALLEALAEHPGQVFGREMLLRRVWGHAFVGDSRTVDVHVQRLRAKLEADPATQRCIETVRGFGYRLVAVGGAEGGG